MPRMKYNPHIIVLDNAIWRTHDKNGKPLKPTSEEYYPKDISDLAEPEKKDDANSAASSTKSEE